MVGACDSQAAARRGHQGTKQMSLDWCGSNYTKAVTRGRPAKHLLPENRHTSEPQTGHQSSLLPEVKSAAQLGEFLVLDYCSKSGRGVNAAGSHSQPCFAGVLIQQHSRLIHCDACQLTASNKSTGELLAYLSSPRRLRFLRTRLACCWGSVSWTAAAAAAVMTLSAPVSPAEPCWASATWLASAAAAAAADVCCRAAAMAAGPC